MPLNVADRVRETTTTTGTGTITLSGTSPTGYQTFSAVGNGNTTYYTINAGSQWEVGIGTYLGAGPTLSRDTVLASSNSGSLVNFSAGTKDVFCDYPASKSISDGFGLLPVPNGGTGTATAFTAGSVVFAGASGVYTQDNANLFWDNTNDRLGIGTVSPVAKLHIDDQNNAGFRLNQYNDGDGSLLRMASARGTIASPTALLTDSAIFGVRGFGYSSAGTFGGAVAQINARAAENFTSTAQGTYLTFITTPTGSTTAAEAMRITSAGNVGVGTGSPGRKLTVSSADDTPIQATSSGANSFIQATGSSGSVYFGAIGTAFGVLTNATERMRIDSSGNVGIGTSAPSTILHAVASGSELRSQNTSTTQYQSGRVRLKGPAGTYRSTALTHGNNNTGGTNTYFAIEGADSSDNYLQTLALYDYASQFWLFSTNSAERMRITSGGNVGIGTSAPAATLEVSGGLIAGAENRQTHPATGPVGFKAQWNYTGGDGETDFYNLYAPGTTSFRFYQSTGSGTAQLLYNMRPSSHEFYTGGTERMRINSSGNVGIGTSSPQGLLHVVAGTNDSLLVRGPINLGTGGSIYAVNSANSAVTPFEFGASVYYFAGGNVGIGTSTPGQKLTVAGTIETTSGGVKFPDGTTQTTAAGAVSYPQNIQSANYTLVLGDAGKQIFHPVADTAFRTYTIPSNASVAFPIGTVVLFTVENGGFPVNVAINSDTLVFGSGTTGTVAVAANNTLMAIKVTSTKWMANYLYQTGSAASSGAIAVAHSSTPFITAYPWSSSTGYGTKYANPASLPPGAGNGVAFSPAGNAIAVAHTTTPFISAYLWSSTTGFSTKYSNPATLPAGIGRAVAFNPAATSVAVGHDNTPFITAYPWNASTGFGTKYADPATVPGGSLFALGVAFSPAGDAIAVASDGSPRVQAYPWNASTGFGTKYADPATLPTGTGVGVAFSPAGDAIAVGHSTTPFISAYPWNVSTGFGTKYTNPATLPTGNGGPVAFTPAGDAIAVQHSNSPFVTAYPWSSSGFGTKYADPATSIGATNGVAFSPGGNSIGMALNATPFIAAYSWTSASGFGTRFSNPASLPSATVANSVAFHPFV